MTLPDIPILSIRQPWAWAIVNGYKPVENRVWPTNVRGPILIHASAHKCTEAEWQDFCEVYRDARGRGLFGDRLQFQRGGIIGMANIVDCVTYHPSAWFFGPYGFVMEKAKELPFVPMKGRLGFFRAPNVTA